jgi:hypothetical protein
MVLWEFRTLGNKNDGIGNKARSKVIRESRLREPFLFVRILFYQFFNRTIVMKMNVIQKISSFFL